MKHTISTVNTLYKDEYQRIKERLPGQVAWVRDIRNKAILNYETFGFPSLANEEWKYTNILPIVDKFFPNQVSTSHETFENIINRLKSYRFLDDAYYAILYHGQLLLNNIPLPKGCVLSSLSSQLNNNNERSRDMLIDTIHSPLWNGFAALNTALFEQGYYLAMLPHTQITKPLHIFIICENEGHQVLRNIIDVSSDASANIYEHYIGFDGKSYLTNTVTECRLQPRAQLRHIKVIEEGKDSYHIGHTCVLSQSHSSFETGAFALSGAIIRNDTSIYLKEALAEAKLYGLYYVNANQLVDHHTSVFHNHSNTKSREHYRGVVDKNGAAVFNGKIYVEKETSKVDAELSNKNILLSNQAVVNTKPELQIYADDVRCTHGATVGQLDENALYYLKTRGFTHEIASQLLLKGFVHDVIEEAQDKALATYLDTKLFTSHNSL